MPRGIELTLTPSGAFEKLRNVNISFIIPACLSVCPVEQIGSHCMDFNEIWYSNILKKSVENFQYQ
jgi:hypothetical protein